MKKKKSLKLRLLDRSRPRPVIRQRPAVFEDRKKFKRSRMKAAQRRELNDE